MADQWVRYFSVTDPRRHTKGFTVYKVISTVFPRNCPEAKTELVVWKRFKEFQKLYKDLKSRHEKLYLKDQFPPFSKPCLFGRFESDVIEERRLAAQSLLDFTANHPPLFTSQSCVTFFEKSHKVLLVEETQCSSRQNNLTLPVPLSPNVSRECDDVLSQSSSHSTLTDTDSATSVVNFPSQEEPAKFGNNYVPGITSPTSPSSERSTAISDETTKSEPKVKVETAIEQVDDTDDIDSFKVEVPCLENNEQLKACQEKPHEAQSCSSVPRSNSNPTLKENSSVERKPLQHESLVIDYITHAGYLISQAVEYETNSCFELAFSSYKAAISCLLSGVQDDSSEDRKSLVQRKASQYLIRAEQIYHNHLDGSHSTTRTIPEATDMPLIQESFGCHSLKSLEAPIADLKTYKVLGVVSSLILALNTSNNTPYIVKVLHKSSCPVDRRTKSILPCNVPFMCRMHSFIENDRAVFLVLEQARGGRLWDHISPYLEVYRNPESSSKTFADFLTGCAEKSENVLESLVKNQNIRDTNQPGEELQRNIFSDDSHYQNSNNSMNKSCAVRSPTNVYKRSDTQQGSQNYGNIPNVVQKPPSNLTEPEDISVDTPDVLPSKHSNAVDIETADILKNSQKLLESVNSTLSKSEETPNVLLHTHIAAMDNALCEWHQEDQLSCSNSKNSMGHISLKTTSPKCANKGVISSITREHRRSVSREGRPTSRHSRSRIRFSCDDMFEGRARALSKSLDREALQKIDPRVDQGACLGLPIDTVRLWAAQLLLALDALHRWGVVIGDLRPDNLLLGSGLNLVLTYQCQWVCVDHIVHPDAVEQLYAAPEISSIHAKTAASDWWSFGAILFELLSGETLQSCHPGGLHSYSTLHIPSLVCEEGASLLKQLLQFDAQSRLGVGPHGVAKLKAQPFFRGLEWNKVLLMSASV